MAEARVARASVTIDAPVATVWDALVTPETIEQYMFLTSVASDWREGSPILWKSEWQGKSLEVEGTILRFEPHSELAYTYSRPIVLRSGARREPRHYYRVTITLSDEGARTRVAVVQDNNATAQELAHSEGGWRLTLNGLKALLEGHRTVPGPDDGETN